jgi:hypothetical protein
MVVFTVDDVDPVRTRLRSRRLGDLTGEVLVIGGDPDLLVLEPDGVHPLLSAVARAFAEHRPLVLSPDAVWLTIASGVAQHIRLHAEELRPRLVSHLGRGRLAVTLDGPMPVDAASWADLVAEFSKLLAAEIRDAEVFECDFSTSTEVERTAGRVVLMDAYSPYFSYWLVVVCGIPQITLTGTAGDWRKIRDRIGVIAGLGLEKWCRSLAPIADQLVRAAQGDVDVEFWRRIYNPVDAYGGKVITGWAARLYPYLESDGAVSWPNPLLELPVGEPRDLTPAGRMGYNGPGIRSDGVPATLSRVIVNVCDAVSGDTVPVELNAGLVGVTQDEDGSLRPVAGWHLARATADIGEVIDRLVTARLAEPAKADGRRGPRLEGPGEIMALYDRIASATFLGGSWRLRPVAEHSRASLSGPGLSVVIIADLPDGRSLAAVTRWHPRVTHWITARFAEDDPAEGSIAGRLRLWPREDKFLDAPADVPVYGTSLARILAAALDNDGDITHLESGRLSDLVRGDLGNRLRRHRRGASQQRPHPVGVTALCRRKCPR